MKWFTLLALCASGVHGMNTHQTQLGCETVESVRQRLGENLCAQIKSQWSMYEKKCLVTQMLQPRWPAPHVGEPIYYAREKEVFKDYIKMKIGGRIISLGMADLSQLLELNSVAPFTNYNSEMMKFDKLRDHFETEDEIWDQLNKQLIASQKNP